jgi:hypothetical protein
MSCHIILQRKGLVITVCTIRLNTQNFLVMTTECSLVYVTVRMIAHRLFHYLKLNDCFLLWRGVYAE